MIASMEFVQSTHATHNGAGDTSPGNGLVAPAMIRRRPRSAGSTSHARIDALRARLTASLDGFDKFRRFERFVQRTGRA
jgi:hypothetical protein